jgi:hypothetical protein
VPTCLRLKGLLVVVHCVLNMAWFSLKKCSISLALVHILGPRKVQLPDATRKVMHN